ncbi:MAG: heavy-metal-associated domain-containing protein [Betaproteobacteria bacterium]|nr:heavy-metal-associated domain-containing protein [Betaproteobacteria bacterium]
MNTTTLTVTGMSCMGCVNSVKNLVSALPGVIAVEVDLASGRVEVRHDLVRTDVAALRGAIEAGGYAVVG